MVQNLKYFYTIALLATFVTSAYTIQCYVCDTTDYPQCGYAVEVYSRFAQNCDNKEAPSYIREAAYNLDLNATGCMEKTAKKADGHLIITRSCFFGDVSELKEGCRDDPFAQFETLFCNVCNTQLCNDNNYADNISSTSKGSTATVITIIFAMVAWMS